MSCIRKSVLTTRLLPSSRSTLLPSTTNGKFSGSDGLACTTKLLTESMDTDVQAADAPLLLLASPLQL